MNMETDTLKLKEKYLLGELSEEEMAQVEEKYFVDDDFFDDLLATEYDLIDRYVRGELSPQDRQRFEKAFLGEPRRRERVEYARALRDYRPEARLLPFRKAAVSFLACLRPQARYTLAASALAAAAVFCLLAVSTFQLQFRLTGLRGEVERLRAGRDVISFVVSPGVRRGGEEQKKLVIPTGDFQVEMRLEIDPELAFVGYRAEVQDSQSRVLWSTDLLKAEKTETGQTVVARLPAKILTPGDVIIQVEGVMPDGSRESAAAYSFFVTRP